MKQIPKISSISDINALAPIERKVLQYYAFLSRYSISENKDALCKHLKITSTTYNSILQKLLDKDALVKGSYYYNDINPYIRVSVLANMALQHREDEEFLIKCSEKKNYFRQYLSDNEAISIYSIIKYATGVSKTRPKTVPPESFLFNVMLAYNLTIFPKLISFFNEDDVIFETYNLIDRFACQGKKLTDEVLDNINGKEFKSSYVNIQLSDIKSMYRYYLYGEFKMPDYKLTERPYMATLCAVRAANEGRYSEAITYFTTALKKLNPNRVLKNVMYGFLPSYYMIMSYVHIGNEASIKKLNQYLNKKEIDTYFKQYISVALAQAYTSSSHSPERSLLYRAMHLEIDNIPFTNIILMSKMVAKYFDISFRDCDKSWQTDINQYPVFGIVKHEISKYLTNLSDNEREQLVKKYGENPMLTSIIRKEGWEWVVEDVVRSIDASATETGIKTNKSRLIYLVNSNEVVPMVQSRLKSGNWGTPKSISRKKIEEEDIPTNEEADRKFCAKVRAKNQYSYTIDWPTPEEALPMLKDTGRIFLSDDYTAPVNVEEEDIYIRVNQQPKSNSISVTSNVTRDELANAKDNCVLKKTDKSTFKIIKMSPNSRLILEKLLQQGQFPAKAEEAIKNMLTRVEEVVEVRSPLLNSESIPTVDANTTLHARVTPMSGNMYGVDFQMQPIQNGSVYMYPGEGRQVIYDMVDGKNIRTKRNLKAESKIYKSMLDEMGFIDSDNTDNGYTFDLTVDEILELMDFASANQERINVEWLQGKGLTLSHPATSTWNVGLKSTNDWFEIEGDVRVNEQTVISMAKLLELIGENKGKYIKLNDNDYMEISSKLRRQLERIESLSTKNHNKMTISTFNAALLDDKALDGELKVAFDNKLIQLRDKIKNSANYSPEVPTTLNAQLRPYQIDGYQWMARLASWGAGACLADDMGLGKTVETIAFLLLKASEGPALVVAPASVVPNWLNEIGRFAPSLTPHVLNKATDRKALINEAEPYDVILSTYGILNTEDEALSGKNWTTIVLDEAHIIKNKGTKMSQAVMSMKAEYRIILTGTPIQNHLGELWNLFRFINPGLLGSDESFRRKFVNPIQEGNKDRQRALQRIISPFMLRRTKADVVDDLPDKTEIVLPVELSEEEMSMYEAMRIKAANVINESEKVDVNTLAEITKLRRAACSMHLIDSNWKGTDSKVQTLLDLVGDIHGSNNRMLIFSQFTSFLSIVREALDKAGIKYLYLDGSTTMKERERMVKKFKEGDIQLFLISLKAGGLGLNLPEANYVVHLDPWWNPAIEQQATDRAYRIGQKRNVTVYHLVAKNTIEEKIRRLHRTKRDLADSLLEGTDMAAKLGIKEILELVSDK